MASQTAGRPCVKNEARSGRLETGSHTLDNNNNNNNPAWVISTDDSGSIGQKREKCSGGGASTSVLGALGARIEHYCKLGHGHSKGGCLLDENGNVYVWPSVHLQVFTLHKVVHCYCMLYVCLFSILCNQVRGLGRVPGSVCMRSKNMPAYWGTQCKALWRGMREIMEKARAVLGTGR